MATGAVNELMLMPSEVTVALVDGTAAMLWNTLGDVGETVTPTGAPAATKTGLPAPRPGTLVWLTVHPFSTSVTWYAVLKVAV
jgi:hypothetical protein